MRRCAGRWGLPPLAALYDVSPAVQRRVAEAVDVITCTPKPVAVEAKPLNIAPGGLTGSRAGHCVPLALFSRFPVPFFFVEGVHTQPH